MLTRRYANVPGPRPPHYPEPGTRPQERVPYARTSVRVWGERQICALEMMCARDCVRPHQMVQEIVLDRLREELKDPAFAAGVKAMMAAQRKWQRGRGRAALRVIDGKGQ